jgi:hypothetical protein
LRFSPSKTCGEWGCPFCAFKSVVLLHELETENAYLILKVSNLTEERNKIMNKLDVMKTNLDEKNKLIFETDKKLKDRDKLIDCYELILGKLTKKDVKTEERENG